MSEPKFPRTKLVLGKFSLVLSKIGDDTELKNYFTGYILIVFYCEFENQLKKVLKETLEKNSTEQLSTFIMETMDTIFKRINKKDIEKTIKYFGTKKKQKFQSLINDTTIQQYQNLIENRHVVAHSNNGISVSWEEIKNIIKVGEEIIVAVRDSLKP